MHRVGCTILNQAESGSPAQLNSLSRGSYSLETPPKKGQSGTKLTHFHGAFLTVGDVAKSLGIPRQTIKRWCESGKIPAIQRPYGDTTTFLIAPQAVELLRISLEEKRKLEHFSGKLKKQPQNHGEMVKPWLKAMERGMLNGKVFSCRTIETYRLYGEKFFERHHGLTVETLKAELMQIPSKQYAKRDKVYKTLVCLGKYLIQEGMLNPEFLEAVKLLAPKRHLPPKRVSVDEAGIRKLLVACESTLDTLIIILLSQTGLRASEACQLRLSDIDLERGILTVRCGKGGKSRKVGLTSITTITLQEYLASHPQTCPEQTLLLNRLGQAMDRQGLFQRVERVSIEAEVPASPHALRRSFVTLNANQGRSLVMLQHACGHVDIKTTRSYCMTTEQEVIEAMKSWD